MKELCNPMKELCNPMKELCMNNKEKLIVKQDLGQGRHGNTTCTHAVCIYYVATWL